ncbi:GNAT family N-acetyltransferase [Leucobacter sp.]
MSSIAAVLAGPDDAETLARLQADFNAEFESPCPAHADLARRFRAILASPVGYAVFAGPPGAPDGFALITLRPTIYSDGPLAVLDELYVRPPRRADGIGTAILERAVAELCARGGEEMHINVDEVDVDTRRFYERHGFANTEPGVDGRMLLYVREFA